MDVEKFINSVVARFIGTKHERDVKELQPLVEEINALEPEMRKLSDAEITAKTAQLKQQFTDNVMGYLTYSRGYSPAAYNTSAVLFSDEPLQPVGKETINSYEIGSKGSYLDRTLNLNADIFDTVYSNYQIQSYSAVPGAITRCVSRQFV